MPDQVVKDALHRLGLGIHHVPANGGLIGQAHGILVGDGPANQVLSVEEAVAEALSEVG